MPEISTSDLLRYKRLEIEIKDSEARVAQLETVQKTQEVVSQERERTIQKQLAAKDATISQLQAQLQKQYEQAGADEALLKANVQNALTVGELTRAMELKVNQVAELTERLYSSELELKRVDLALREAQQLYLNAQEENSRFANQLAALNQKTQAAFEVSDISNYLTSAINDFNSSTNTGDAAVNYIINALDIEMRASIAKTEDNRLLMAAPSLSANNADSLSVIKFSISAVPKDTAND